ncbi:MAG TPA: BPSS1780 family membrane protein [Burkholderiales bacterium]|nr:BPSS1780 family membrane protein [Burkholderiales bacterium]
MSSNPYAAPKAAVADAVTAPQGNFVPGGRGVAAGRGWDWIVSGWELFKKQPGIWIGLVVVALIIFVVLAIIPFIGSLAMAVLGPVFAAGVMLGCRRLSEGGELEIGHLFAGFKDKFGTLAAVGALNLAAQVVIMIVVMLITGASLFTLSGGGAGAGAAMGIVLVLLIMLGLMVSVAMAVWFAFALVVLQGRGAVEALKESFSGCLKNIVPFLLYGIVLMIAGFIAAIPLGLGYLVFLPVVAGSLYASYQDIYFTS